MKKWKMILSVGIVVTVALVLFGGIFPIVKHAQIRSLNESIESGDKLAFQDKLRRTLDVNYPSRSALGYYLEASSLTPLQTACRTGNLEMVETLLEKGAKPNHTAISAPIPPILLALSSDSPDNTKVAECMLDAGADINAVFSGSDAIDYVCSLNHDRPNAVELLELLNDNGADVKGAADRCFRYACRSGNEDLIRYFITDANVRACEDNGQTMLIDYVTNQYGANPETVSLFLENGADLTAKDNDGKTAYDYAIEKGYTYIAELIKPSG